MGRRLCVWENFFADGTLLKKAYRKDLIEERHRHRYEFNNDYRKQMEKSGLVISGTSPDENLVEAVEISSSQNRFHLGVQFHPEFKSRPTNPSPLFVEFLKSCKN